MTPPLLIILGSLFLMLLSVLFNWRLKIKNKIIKLYWIFILFGAIACIIFRYLPISELKNIFFSSSNINPIKILVIFLSCTSLSVLLDQIGFFEYLAKIVIKHFKSNQIKLFFALNFLIALLTIFTSNDILILTFTPFICFFTKHAKINATPYIISEFVTANAWSMFFFIDNPTNIYICSIFNISFLDYAKTMFLPTIAAGLISLLVTFLIFRKTLQKPIQKTTEKITKLDKIPLSIGLLGLSSTIVLMILSSWTNWDLWIIPLLTSSFTFLIIFCYLKITNKNLNLLKNSLKKIPYELIPFLLGMSVLISTLKSIGVIDSIVSIVQNSNLFTMGIFAFLSGNIVNNIPMTMLFTEILSALPIVSPKIIYSVVIASNICAFLTPIGALAGIMFINILRENKVSLKIKDFIRYGAIISLPTLFIALLTLSIL